MSTVKHIEKVQFSLESLNRIWHGKVVISQSILLFSIVNQTLAVILAPFSLFFSANVET